MATRILPGVYTSLNDLSQLPEGQTALNVGFVLQANRGPVNEAQLVTSPSDFLTKYTFSGQPSISDDPTFWSILKVLAQTNSMYVVRAASSATPPQYGGIVFKRAFTYGNLTSVTASTKTIVFGGSPIINPVEGDVLCLSGTGTVDGYYTVASVTAGDTTITVVVTETIAADYTPPTGTTIEVKSAPGKALTTSIASPSAYTFDEDEDLFLITGINPGAYNSHISFEVTSALDNPTELVYVNGASVGHTDAEGNPINCWFNTMQLVVKNADTNATLETYLFSRDNTAKTVDGTSLYIEDVITGSAYIQVVNNDTALTITDLPYSTNAGAQQAGAGTNGAACVTSDLVAALNVFADKTIPVSIIGNGCSTQAESLTFQQALLNLTSVTRKDCIAFLNNRYSEDETASIASTRAQNIVNYKKGTGSTTGLGATTFYGTMYCPHVKTADIYNSRNVRIGSDAVAIAGWLSVINTLNYPYAYAGPQNGLVTGVTCDWKIGDQSGEAQLLNDASINYVAFDGKVGRYYMQTQNTLQIANSAMRRIGCFMNVLNIKETLTDSLKEYLGLPITDTLRQDIMSSMTNLLEPMVGTRLRQYSLQDVSTDTGIDSGDLSYIIALNLTGYLERIYVAFNIVNSTYFDATILQSL